MSPDSDARPVTYDDVPWAKWWALMAAMVWFRAIAPSSICGVFLPDGTGEPVCLTDYLLHFYWIGPVPMTLAIILSVLQRAQRLDRVLLEQGKCAYELASFSAAVARAFPLALIGTAAFAGFMGLHAPRSNWWSLDRGGWLCYAGHLTLCGGAIGIAVSVLVYVSQVAGHLRLCLRSPQSAELGILRANAYHHDGCGGLRWTMQPFLPFIYSVVPLYMIGIVVAMNCSRDLSWRNPLVIWNIIWPTFYGPVMIAAFFKATGVREHLLRARATRLRALDEKLEKELLAISVTSREGTAGRVNALSEQNDWQYVEHMISLRNRIDRDSPVWPIPKAWIAVIAGAWPVLLVVLGKLASLLKIIN